MKKGVKAEQSDDDFGISEFHFHDCIVAPLVKRPSPNSFLLSKFKTIFKNGPDSIRRECCFDKSSNGQILPQLNCQSETESDKQSTAPINKSAQTKSSQSDFIENSQLYRSFTDDFALILEFCLHPNKKGIHEYREQVSVHSFALLEKIKQCRINKLKTEQRVKKIINHAYDLMKRGFLSSQHKNMNHVSEEHKQEVFVHYFNKQGHSAEEFLQQNKTKPIWRASERFNLAYNRRFFNYIRDCPVFLKDLRETISQLEDCVVETIKNDLRLFIKDVVRFSYFQSNKIADAMPELSAISQFFNRESQKQLNKKGIKFPWTMEQYKQAIQTLRTFVRGKSSGAIV